MNLREYQHAAVTEFRGQWTSTEPTDIPATHALDAANVQYRPGEVLTRAGFGVFYSLGERARSLYNWVRNTTTAIPTGNALIYIAPSSGKARIIPDLSSPTPSDLFTLTNMTNAVIVQAGVQAFIAPLLDNGTSAGQLRIIRAFGAAINVDKAFIGPMTATPVVTETWTAGECTPGLHKWAYLVESRNGGMSRLCPVSGAPSDTFSPVSATLEGDKQVSVGWTATYAAEASLVHLCMTTARNPDRWYRVPGATLAVMAGVPFPLTFTVSISDESLDGLATEVTDRQDGFCQDSSGNGPFNPHAVVEIGNRMGYMTTLNGNDLIYVSDPNDPQAITANKHRVYLPGFRKMTAAIEMGGALYVWGPSWTYAKGITTDYPVNWPEATLVDGQIGAGGPHCVDANAAMGYVFVANPSGLWLFNGGSYAEKPMSYNQDDLWRRINWTTPTKIIVKDMPSVNKVRVWAPIDAATDPNYCFTFDYQLGASPEAVAFSLDSIAGRSVDGMCLFKNPSTSQMEVMLSAKESTKLLRELDTAEANWWLDEGTWAITSFYETALLPGLPTGLSKLLNFIGVDLRIRGSGLYSLSVKTLDAVRNLVYPNKSLESAPGREIFRGLERGVRAESISVRVANSGAGWWSLSTVKVYFREWMAKRIR